MAFSYGEQLEQLVGVLRPEYRAHMCDGDPTSAVAWNEVNEITVRLTVRGDELWIHAGSGLLARFISPSDGDFDQETIGRVVREILDGGAVEFFSALTLPPGSTPIASGFMLASGSMSSGRPNQETTACSARIAGSFAQAWLPDPE